MRNEETETRQGDETGLADQKASPQAHSMPESAGSFNHGVPDGKMDGRLEPQYAKVRGVGETRCRRQVPTVEAHEIAES